MPPPTGEEKYMIMMIASQILIEAFRAATIRATRAQRESPRGRRGRSVSSGKPSLLFKPIAYMDRPSQ